MYWNIDEILTYQRNFNFINGPRSIGKTYTTQKKILSKCIQNKLEFVYVVRTQDEKKNGIFQEAFQKVIVNEFKNYIIVFDKENCKLRTKETETQLGYCIALSETEKIKKRSFPYVKYMVMDEYMLESNSASSYVKGWKEPDLFLNLYHTIDREEDRVIAFLLGNNTAFYNPYHMHPAFNIQPVPPGQIYKTENVLYQNAQKSEEMILKNNTCKFLKMIENTNYGNYASEGNYINDNTNLIAESNSMFTKYLCTVICDNQKFGIYESSIEQLVLISDKIDPYCKMIYSLDFSSHFERSYLVVKKPPFMLEYIAKMYNNGFLRFINMETKLKTEKYIQRLI